MKKRICTMAATILCMALLLVGCGSESAQAGVWSGNTFTNEWFDFKMTVPENSVIQTKDDMTTLLKDSLGETGIATTYINDGTSGEKSLGKYANIYDFMVVLPDGGSSIQLVYENTTKTTAGKNITETEYLDILKNQFSQAGYEIGDSTTKDLAGHTFTFVSANFNGGQLLQDYYVVKDGIYMATIIVTYTSASKETVDSIISGITTAK